MLKDKNNLMYLSLAKYKIFWILKEKTSKLVFNLKKNKFYIMEFFSVRKDEYYAYSNLRRWSFSPILLVVLFTAFLQFTNPYIESIIIFLRDFSQGYINNNISIKFERGSEYITFFSAIAAIGGVFIALYFSTLSAVNATLYTTFSNNLRDLLYRESVGNLYIKYLSYVTFFSFSLSAFYIICNEQIYLALPIMLILIGITIFSYNNLGIYTSKLLNVDVLSNSIFKNVYKCIKNSTNKVFYSDVKTFQNHYYTNANQEINILCSLLDVSLEKYKIHNDSLFSIAQNMLKLLLFYEKMKKKIPHESLWYQQKKEYKDLFKSFDHTASIYIHASMIPDGKQKFDTYWVEQKLVPYLIKIIIEKLKNQEVEHYKILFEQLNTYIAHLVYFGNIKYAISIVEMLKKDFLLNDVSKNIKEYEILKDIYSLPLTIIENFCNNLRSYSYDYVANVVENNNLRTDDLQSTFHEEALFQLSWLKKRLNFEYEAEQEEVTPKWYQIEIMILGISENFINNLESILLLLENYIDEELEKKNDIQSLSIVLTQQWEIINKLIYHYSKVEELLHGYEQNRKISGLKWKKYSIENFNARISNLKKKCVLKIADNMVQLGKHNNNNDSYPDILGYFLHITSGNLLDLAINKEFEDLENIYQKFMISSIVKFSILKPLINEGEEIDWHRKHELVSAFKPIAYLMELTGLIKIILEFYNEETLWKKIVDLWFKSLSSPQLLPPELLKIIILMSEEQFNRISLDEQAFNWEKKVQRFLNSKIKKMPYYRKKEHYLNIFNARDIFLHESSLLRVYLESQKYSGYDGVDIFIFEVLKKFDAEKKYNFGGLRNSKDLEAAIEKSNMIYNEYLNDKKN